MTERRPWTCHDGDWFGVLAPDLVVLLPPDERPRAAEVWALVDAGAGFEEVLDALLAGGLRDRTGFVLVDRSAGAGGETRVLVRGTGSVRLAGPEGVVVVAPDPDRTWVEERVPGATSLAVAVGTPPAPPAPPGPGGPGGPGATRLLRGLVRVGGVALEADGPSAEEPGSELPEPLPETGPRRLLDRPTGPGAGEDLPGAPTEAMPLPSGSLDPDFPPEPSPARAATPATDAPVARLLFSSGDVADVDRVVVVGRAPTAGRAGAGGDRSGGPEPRLVTVPSPQQGISATHLEVRPGTGPDLGLAVATDLGSTNGTLLVQPGLPPEDLKAGVGVPLLPGALLDLGDGLTIRLVVP